MTNTTRIVGVIIFCSLAWAFLGDRGVWGSRTSSSVGVSESTGIVCANELLRRQPGFFVPNLGQWDHAARFVHRSGAMTVFLEDRGWVVDIVERSAKPKRTPRENRRAVECESEERVRGVALRMTFSGDGHVPEIICEKELPGHHNYFLGSDESRWRSGVPLYGSVRYEGLYPGVDLRLREAKGVPEYDLLLQPGADLSQVVVQVEGGQSLSIEKDGSLVIATGLGRLTQPMPKTWQLDADGRKREVVCNFVMLGADRFGFEVPGWDGDTSLTIDPGLIWSTFLGGSGVDGGWTDLVVDASGAVTLAGITYSTRFPTTTGAYDTIHNGNSDVFISRLDPSKTGTAQLVYSTFLGGSSSEEAYALDVDAVGVVTVAGRTPSRNFPTTVGAYDTTHNGPIRGADIFVSRLDPSKTGTAQLVYSTFLGGSGYEWFGDLSVDSTGAVTVAGFTWSSDYPTTSGAYDTVHNGSGTSDVFVSRLVPAPVGRMGLLYSTFLGGKDYEFCDAVFSDALGVITVAGTTDSKDFPASTGAYDSTYNGGGGSWYGGDVFVSRLDSRKKGSAQLVYSTYLGGTGNSGEIAAELVVDASGVVTVAGATSSPDFPTTRGAYGRAYNGYSYDVFVSRLDPRKTGAAQLVYSTFLGGNGYDGAYWLSVDAGGVVTIAGGTNSKNFPTTRGAYATTYNGGPPWFRADVFVSRLDPRKTGAAQLIYSTFLGGSSGDVASGGIHVDASGVATLAGRTASTDFPTTSGAYDTTHNGINDAFISRLDMGVAMYGDVHELRIATGGTQMLTVNAGRAHANRLYWIFGSITGTQPGVNLLGVHIPLNPDLYTNLAMANVNTTVFTKFRGTLDANGLATASFKVPANLPLPPGFTFHHAYVVYDASGKFYMASNAVPVRLK